NIAYLNQFFSALVMVSNVAPGTSSLVVHDVTAEIVLPTGTDTVADTGDDPLRMARTGNPPVAQAKIQPVTEPGPAGKLGTPDDAQTVSFHLLSQQTGTVTATSFTSEGIPGKFELRTAVGANGIPMSPNSLVLSPAADALPEAIRTAGVGMLGQAFALATAPATPKGLLPLTQQIVYERATNLSEAGQRLGMGDSLASVVRDLAFDWSGSD